MGSFRWVVGLVVVGACGDPEVGGSGGTIGSGSETGAVDETAGGDPSTESGDSDGSETTDASDGPGESSSGSETGSTGRVPEVCGDGIVNGDEACDDAINDGGYGSCTADCTALGPHCGDGIPQAEEVCDDGNDVHSDGCNPDCIVSGTVLWQIPVTPSIQVDAVVIDDEDTLFVAGTDYQPERGGNDPILWLGSYQADGSEVWTQTWQSVGGGLALGHELTVRDEELLVIGSHKLGGADDFDLLAQTYSMDGDPIDSFESPGWYGFGVALDQAGDAYIVGTTNASDLRIGKFAPDGTPSWTDDVDGSGESDYGWSVAVGGETVFAVGTLELQSNDDVGVVRSYDLDGALQWTHQLDADGETRLYDVAVDTEGDVVARRPPGRPVRGRGVGRKVRRRDRRRAVGAHTRGPGVRPERRPGRVHRQRGEHRRGRLLRLPRPQRHRVRPQARRRRQRPMDAHAPRGLQRRPGTRLRSDQQRRHHRGDVGWHRGHRAVAVAHPLAAGDPA